MRLLRMPLLRLLAVNLAIGVTIAVLMLGGMLGLNLYNLRDLIFADQMGAAALGLLAFGLIVTFGSVAMGGAIMLLGERETKDGGGGLRAPALAPAMQPKTAKPH